MGKKAPNSGIKSRRTKKTKQFVDPNAPKRHASSYFYFLSVRRNELKEEQPNLKNNELVLELGRDWNALSDVQKLVFEKLSEADRIRYEREFEEYAKNNPHIIEIMAQHNKADNEQKSEEDNNDNTGIRRVAKKQASKKSRKADNNALKNKKGKKKPKSKINRKKKSSANTNEKKLELNGNIDIFSLNDSKNNLVVEKQVSSKGRVINKINNNYSAKPRSRNVTNNNNTSNKNDNKVVGPMNNYLVKKANSDTSIVDNKEIENDELNSNLDLNNTVVVEENKNHTSEKKHNSTVIVKLE